MMPRQGVRFENYEDFKDRKHIIKWWRRVQVSLQDLFQSTITNTKYIIPNTRQVITTPNATVKYNAKSRWWKHTSLHSETLPPGTEQSTITGSFFCLFPQAKFFFWSWASYFIVGRCAAKLSSSWSAWSIMISIIIIRTIIMATTTTKFNSLIVFRCAASKESRQWVDQGVGKKLKMIQVFSSITFILAEESSRTVLNTF